MQLTQNVHTSAFIASCDVKRQSAWPYAVHYPFTYTYTPESRTPPVQPQLYTGNPTHKATSTYHEHCKAKQRAATRTTAVVVLELRLYESVHMQNTSTRHSLARRAATAHAKSQAASSGKANLDIHTNQLTRFVPPFTSILASVFVSVCLSVFLSRTHLCLLVSYRSRGHWRGCVRGSGCRRHHGRWRQNDESRH